MAKLYLVVFTLFLLISLVLSVPSKSGKHDKKEKHESEETEEKEEHNKKEKHEKEEKHKAEKSDKHAKHKHSHKSKEQPEHDQEKENEIENQVDATWNYENKTKVDTRRVLYSKTTSKGRRPYMVYLQLTKESAKAHKYRGWLCGGVIVDRYYVLTSAACVEDADHFYVVSGTTKFVDSFDYKDDECVCKHRRKVVWKCIPKNYKFDFQDSIKWSSNDIAIVKVEKPFKFGVCEKGCEFATDLICYNNVSRDLEKPGTKGYIAGWGSGSNFREGVYRRQKPYAPENAKCLQEARVCIMDNEQCAKKWSQRFRSIITQYMICTKDVMKRLSEICDKRYANCTDVESRREIGHDDSSENLSKTFNVDLGRHLRDPDDYTARRSSMQGGFCENDHGGPLIVKYQNKERVIGVISACKIDPKSHNCHGPFLYTSVFKNRQFISCSIYKDVEESCRRVFRSGITHEEWSVNWENVKEDDDDNKDKKDEETQDIKADSDDSDKADEDSGNNESKEVLRENKEKDDKTTKEDDEAVTTVKVTAVRAKSDSDSSESSNSSQEKQHDKTEEKKTKSKPKKTKSKSKSKDKKHSSSKKKEKSTRKTKRSKDDPWETVKVRSHDTKEVFYQSSRDDNVNEPDDE